MAYTCRVYLNSGFNAVNIPDSPDLLNSVDFIDCDALEILQNRNLPYIDIAVTSYDAIKNADYCRLNDWFYFVDNIIMLNATTCRLVVYSDFLTSAGGAAALTLLDGITSRVCVGSDDYGEWPENDPYMAPAQSLKLAKANIYAGDSGKGTAVIKTTLDLAAMASNYQAKVYTDPDTLETVTIPVTQINDASATTDYKITTTDADGNSVTEYDFGAEPHTALYLASNNTVQEGLSKAQSIGISGAITAQVALPVTLETNETTGRVTSATGQDIIIGAAVGAPYVYADSTYHNCKLWYSDYTPYGLLTCAGEQIEFLPVEVYDNADGQGAPYIRTVADPRIDGKPYYGFKTINGLNDNTTFFTHAVAGLSWKEYPLVYEGAEGSALKGLEHLQNANTARLDYAQSYNQAARVTNRRKLLLGASGVTLGVAGLLAGGAALGVGAAGSAISGITGVIGAQGAAAIAGGAGATVAGALAQGVNEWTGQADLDRQTAKYERQKAAELASYFTDTHCYTPTLSFVPAADIARNILRNGCVYYRYEYTDYDLARIDRILTMYGYKVTKSIERADFNNREYFNYIEAGVTVGKLPKWHADGVAAQLANGVRIWHVLPDPGHYIYNPFSS